MPPKTSPEGFRAIEHPPQIRWVHTKRSSVIPGPVRKPFTHTSHVDHRGGQEAGAVGVGRGGGEGGNGRGGSKRPGAGFALANIPMHT